MRGGSDKKVSNRSGRMSKAIAILARNAKKRLWAVLFSSAVSSVGAMASSQEMTSDLSQPTARYLRQGPSSALTLSHWAKEITLDVLSPRIDAQALHAVSMVDVLSDHAAVDMKFAGKISDAFAPKSSVGPGANYIVMFENLSERNVGQGSTLPGKDISFNFADADTAARSILEAGLKKQGQGCFANWSIDSSNAISAFVLVIDRHMAASKRRDCINIATPLSFAVHPAVTTLSYPQMQASQDFFDKSETFLLLRLSAYCRNELKQNSLQCPAEMLGALYQMHANLLKQ